MKKCMVVGFAGVGLLLLSCDSGETATAWGQFSRCMAGDGVEKPADVPARLRSVELNERQPAKLWNAKTQWPGRCEGYASALYNGLSDSTEHKLVKRSIKGQLNCTEAEPATCSFGPEQEILPDAAKLWEFAANAKLNPEQPADVPLPSYDLKLQTAADWKPLVAKDYQIADQLVTASGVLRLLLRSPSGPLTVCDANGPAVNCFAVSAEAPKVAAQSVKLLRDEEAAITGLTEDGRKGFVAKTGKEVTFGGTVGAELRDGVAVRKGEAGFVATKLAGGKERGAADFPATVAAAQPPTAVGNFVTWVEKSGSGETWNFGSINGRSLKSAGKFDGAYQGEVTPCAAEAASVGLWAGSEGKPGAKPGGDGSTVQVSFLSDGSWGKPVTGKMSFKRNVTESRCGEGQLDVFWAGSGEGELEVGQVNCTAKGCKESTSSWPSFGAKRWLTAGMAGDKFVALWVTSLGDTRLRAGDSANFGAASETVLFESPQHGGPLFNQAQAFYTSKAAYLLVLDNGPTLLSVSADGVKSLGGK